MKVKTVIFLLNIFLFSCVQEEIKDNSPQDDFIETFSEVEDVILPPKKLSKSSEKKTHKDDSSIEVRKIPESFQEILNAHDLPPTIHLKQEEGLYNGPTSLEVVCEQNGHYPCKSISYTINGDDPNFENRGTIINKNNAEIIIGKKNGSVSLKIVGRSTTGKVSAVRSFNFLVESSDREVLTSPVGGDYFSPQNINISCDKCKNISFTLDGKEPEFNQDNSRTNKNEINLRIGEVQESITIKYKSIDQIGKISKTYTTRYRIKHRCVGNEISPSGFIPCTYTCHEDGVLYQYSANNNNTSCICSETHFWNTNEKKCKLKNKVLNLLVNSD